MTKHNSLKDAVYQQYLTVSKGGLSQPETDDLESRMRYFHWIFKHRLPPPNGEERVFDAGCGHGAFLLAALNAGYSDVSGVDLSREQVAHAHKLGLITVRQGDAVKELAGSKSGHYDLIIIYDLLEHLDDGALWAIGRSAFKALKNGGHLLVHVPNAEGLFGSRAAFWDITHVRPFTRHSLTQYLRAVGSWEVSVFEDPVIVHGLKSGIRFLIWSLIKVAARLVLGSETGDLMGNHVFTQNLLCVAQKTGGPHVAESTDHAPSGPLSAIDKD